MRKVILFLFTAVVVASCTITERVAFNAKNGGSISYEIDATEFVGYMNMADTTGTGKSFNLGDSLAELRQTTESLKNIPGIHEVSYKSEPTKVTFSFAFDNVEALNKAHVELGVKTENAGAKSYEKVTVKNKKELIYRTWPLGTSAQDSLYETMGLMLTYRLEATFAKPVVETNAKTGATSGNQFLWTSTADDPGGAYAFDGIVVKLK